MCLKFPQNRTINEEFDIFIGVSRKAPLWNVMKMHAKFQIGSSIRNLSAIGRDIIQRRKKKQGILSSFQLKF